LKVCCICKEEKALTEFSIRRRSRDGLLECCKACNAERARRYRAANPSAFRDYSLQAKYGISEADYRLILEAQQGGCAICHGPPNGNPHSSGKIHFHVDHDHETGEVRSLLCSKCNTALGLLDEDQARIRQMLVYLEMFSAKMVSV